MTSDNDAHDDAGNGVSCYKMVPESPRQEIMKQK